MTAKQRESNRTLRESAEEKLKSAGADSHKTPSLDETVPLLHELQVHQIELEMQNEELRRTQHELETSRARYFDLFDLAPVGYFIISEQGVILEANLTAAILLGMSRSELIMQPVSRFIFKEDQEIDYLHRKRLFETGEPRACELRMVKKDGTSFWAYLTASAIQDGDGSSVIRIVLSDISERKRDEALLNGQKRVLELVAAGVPLQESLTALVSLIEEHAPGMLCWILLLDKDGVHLRYGAAPTLPPEFTAAADCIAIGPNAGSCGTAAYRKEAVFVEDIATDPLWNEFKAMALPYGLRACWSTPILDAGRGVLGTFAMFYRQPALPQPDHRRLIDMATQTAAVAIVSHRMATALQESEEFHRLTLNSISDTVFITDDTGAFKYICPNVDVIFGYSCQQVKAMGNIRGLLGENLFSPGEFEALRELNNIERDITEKSGRVRSLLVNVKKVAIKGGTRLYTCRDITERKQAENALWYERALLRCIIDSVSDLIFIKDRDSVYLGCNRESEKFIGLAESEQIGKSDFDFFDREMAEQIRENDRQLIEGGGVFRAEEWVTYPDGRRVLLDTMKVPYYGPDGKTQGLVGICRDITERKRMEEELRKLNEELEQRVRERTRELERRNHDLEQMNKAFVGRELKMAELKERVRELEERVGEGAQ